MCFLSDQSRNRGKISALDDDCYVGSVGGDAVGYERAVGSLAASSTTQEEGALMEGTALIDGVNTGWTHLHKCRHEYAFLPPNGLEEATAQGSQAERRQRTHQTRQTHTRAHTHRQTHAHAGARTHARRHIRTRRHAHAHAHTYNDANTSTQISKHMNKHAQLHTK